MPSPPADDDRSLPPEEPEPRRGRGRPFREPGGGRQLLAAGLLAGSVVVSVLAIGAVHLPVLLVVSALAFGAAAVALRGQSVGQDGLVLPLPTLVCTALAAYTLLQIVPMPIRWLEAVAPATADAWQRCLLPLGEHGPRWASISLDPGASAVEALKWATYGAVFAAASTVSSRHGATSGLYVVYGAGVLAALVTVGHGLADATRVYGLYQPEFHVAPWHVGPLLNPNTLAGYLNLSALSGLGLMLGDRPRLPRWLLGVGVVLLVGIQPLTASRAGIASLFVGVVALAIFIRRRGGDRRAARGASGWMLLAAVAGGVLLAFLGGTGSNWAELVGKDLSKLSMVLWVKPLVRDFPVFGVGRGAFESVFPAYRTIPGNIVYTHAENFAVQWAAEWGVPVALLALGVLGWAFAPRRLGALRSTVAAGAWCGVGALLLQNLLDLGLELPAVSIAAFAVLGSLWGDRHRTRTREALRSAGPLTSSQAGGVAAGTGAVFAALATLALAMGRHDLDTDRRAAREAVEAASHAPVTTGGDAPREILRRAMLRHPAEPYFPLVGATAAFQARSENPIPWLQRSLERAQVNGRAHLLLAEVLAARGLRRQALLELRLAVTDDPAVTGTAALLLTRWTRSYDDLLAAVPEGKPGVDLLAGVGAAIRTGAPSAAVIELGRRCDHEAIRRDPDAIGPRFREAWDLLEALAGSPGAVPCADRAACRAQVDAHAQAIARVDPESWLAPAIRARLLTVEGRPEEAARLLEAVCNQVDDRPSCLRMRVDAAAKVKAPALLDAAAKEVLAADCTSAARCAETAAWLSGLRAGRGESGAAVGLLERAAREDSGNEARWRDLAAAASGAGRHALALDALEHIAKARGGADPELQKRIDAERSQAFGSLLVPPR